VAVDFQGEGLLEGCTTDEAREARRELLQELIDDGVPIEDLRGAVAEGRLALLPAERALMGEPRYTLEELARQSELDKESLLALRRALGMAQPDPDERVMTDEDLEAARRAKRFLEAGVDQGSLLEVARVIGQALEGVAAASRQAMGETLVEPEAGERQLARRLGAASERLGPLMGGMLEFVYRVRLREGLRRDALAMGSADSGELEGGVDVAVAFADLVGFTRLGERLPAADVGRLAGRLAEMAADHAEPPVQLVKTIGDAAMLVSPEPESLLLAVLGLVEAAEGQEDDLPQLSAGATRGTALARAGDWYGRPVNLASRVTDAARPGTVLATRELREAIRGRHDDQGDQQEHEEGEPFRWSRAPARSFKGIHGRTGLYRVRRAAPERGTAS
jgi:adenylate cyclase